MRKFFATLIWIYQKALSPYLVARCRFFPTCSQYAKDSIVIHGVRKGAILSLIRFGKCHPLHKGGVDFVPSVKDKARENG